MKYQIIRHTCICKIICHKFTAFINITDFPAIHKFTKEVLFACYTCFNISSTFFQNSMIFHDPIFWNSMNFPCFSSNIKFHDFSMHGIHFVHFPGFPGFSMMVGTLIYEPWHEISNNVVCATSKASDQPAHMRSLIRAFASRSNILWVLSYWPNSIWSF